MRLREACLRAEFGDLYPGIPPGRWVTARSAADWVLEQVLNWERAAPAAGRLLAEEHFEFRGGVPRGPQWDGAPTRITDPLPE